MFFIECSASSLFSASGEMIGQLLQLLPAVFRIAVFAVFLQAHCQGLQFLKTDDRRIAFQGMGERIQPVIIAFDPVRKPSEIPGRFRGSFHHPERKAELSDTVQRFFSDS